MQVIFEIFAYPLGWLMWGLNQIFNSYGISLLVFTIIMRVLTFPLAMLQQKGTAKSSVLQPKIEAIKKKYPKDQQKQQAAISELYQEEGHNPASGCLPSLIQMPILFGLINVIYNPIQHLIRYSSVELTKVIDSIRLLGTSSPELKLMSFVQGHVGIEPYLTNDIVKQIATLPGDLKEKLSSVDLNFLGINMGMVPTYEFNVLILIPIISGISALAMTILSMKLNSRNMPQQAGTGMMKGMMYIMPLFSFFIAFSVPAGVGIYWIISNLLAILQTFIIYKIYTPEKMAALVEKEKEKNKGKSKKKSFMQKLQEAQTQPATPQKSEISAEDQKRQKEIDKQRLAAARKRAAEKYGDAYNEDGDNKK